MPERLADTTGQRLKAEQPDGQLPTAPHKALMLRLQRVIEPEQVGFCLFARDTARSRQIGQHLQSASTNELIRLRGLDQPFEAVEIAIIGADQDRLEGGRGVTQRRFNGLTVLREAAQEREHARVLLLARKVEDEEDRTRGLIRPIGSAGVALHHAEQFRGSLIPVVERPLHGLARQIVVGAMVRSTVFVSTSIRPSSRDTVRPAQWPSIYLI